MVEVSYLDEAHKASGDYAYCRINRYLEKSKVVYRSVGLSATPGNNISAVQSVISNLSFAKVEARTDTDPDLMKFSKHREVDPIKVNSSIAVELIDQRLASALNILLSKLESTCVLRKNTL